MDEKDARLLADLARHPGWNILRAWATDQRNGYFEKLASELYNRPDTVSPEDLAYKRGFFKGVFRLLNEPVIVNKRLTPDDQEGDTA